MFLVAAAAAAYCFVIDIADLASGEPPAGSPVRFGTLKININGRLHVFVGGHGCSGESQLLQI